jgi:hypothetical protein
MNPDEAEKELPLVIGHTSNVPLHTFTRVAGDSLDVQRVVGGTGLRSSRRVVALYWNSRFREDSARGQESRSG